MNEFTGAVIAAYVREGIDEYTRPSVIRRPKIYIDGDQWCALYGENLQEGVAGFGDSPELACMNFDENWVKSLKQ
jgi:hypothetical protein